MITVVCIVIVVVALAVVGFISTSHKAKRVPTITTPVLSWVSQQILKEYNKLPDNSRPFSDILDVLLALDVKHQRDVVDNHFSSRWGSGHDWHCNCSYYNEFKRECPHGEYKELHSQITGIHRAIADQNHALAVANVQPTLDQLADLKERLRQERELICDVTKEIA